MCIINYWIKDFDIFILLWICICMYIFLFKMYLMRIQWSWFTTLTFSDKIMQYYFGGGTPTKSRNKSGDELSNKISWRKRSSRKTFSDKYPGSKHRYQRFLFFSRCQLVIALGKCSTSCSSVTVNGLILAMAAVHPSCTFVTLLLNSWKSEYRFHTPIVSRILPSRYITRNWACLPRFSDFARRCSRQKW